MSDPLKIVPRRSARNVTCGSMAFRAHVVGHDARLAHALEPREA